MRPFVQTPNLRRYQVHRDLAILVVAVAFCAMPFLSQPFHMDDNFYMDMARNARLKPLFPNDTPYVFEGHLLKDMASHSHPPLQTYFLALVQAIFGEGPGKEWIFHSIAMIHPILAVISLYFLAARFLERPLWPSLVLACTPLFLVMQHNLMTDLPTLAFWLAAVSAFLWATDLKRTGLYAASSLFQFAAMFTSYQAVALAPLLGFYQFRKRGNARGWLSLLAPLLGMGAWFGIGYLHYHRMLLFDTFGYVQSRHAGAFATLGTKFLTVLEYQGWLILFPFFFLYVFGRGLRGRLLALAALLTVYACPVLVPHYRSMDKGIFAVGLITGVFVFGRMTALLKDSLRVPQNAQDSTDGVFLALWYFGVVAYCLVLFTEGSARYILPLLPPVLICFFRQLETMEVPEYRLASPPLLSSAMLASGSLVLSLAWGMALAHADLEFARVYPRAANEFARIAGEADSYFVGEWGARYYFSHAGVQPLPLDESRVRGGSLLAMPRLALPRELPADLRSMTMPLHTLSYELTTPLRTLDWQSPAGFYSSGWGLIPFSMSRKSLEQVEIRQVNFLVERLPWADVKTTAGERPWPGYLMLEGRSPLAVLMNADTSLIYEWRAREPLLLEVECGVSPGSYVNSDSSFEFGIYQRDVAGAVITSARRTLKPGLNKEDRKWQSLQIPLKSAVQGAKTLEFSFQSAGRKSKANAAFAHAVLRPAGK